MTTQAGNIEHTQGVAPKAKNYRIQMISREGFFEGFFDTNGNRDGKGRYTWADGTIGLCTWSDGSCECFDNACTKYKEAEQQKKKRAKAPTLEKFYPNEEAKKKNKHKYRLAKPKCDECDSEELTFKCYKCATKYCKKCEREKTKKGFGTRPTCICLESFSMLGRQEYWGMCVKCGDACKEFTFKCLNCETAYCKRCENKTRHEGFKKIRPPCKCLIDTKGIAVKIEGTALDLDDWKPWSVREHFQQGRRASANVQVQDLIFVIEFRRKGASQHSIKALCHIGSLEEHTQSQLLITDEVKEYVANFSGPKPPAFSELENQWHKRPQPYPKLSLNTAELEQEWSEKFSEKTEDIDSLDIKNFYLTTQSIHEELPELLQRRQIDIGTGWSAVNPPKGYCIICGPRPSLIVYMGCFNMNNVRQLFATHLKIGTGKHFTTAKKGKSIFQQSAASVDVTVLMTAWLKTVQKLGQKCPDDHAEIEKMKLLRIIYHGWKSTPAQIDQFPHTNDDDSDQDLWNRCRDVNKDQLESDEDCDFEATFDLAQKYAFKQNSTLTQKTCMSDIRVPVFGIVGPIPGFKAQTWSMFGPLPPGKIEMGSLKLDRTGAQTDIFPANVKRVKIYPGYVNFLKHFMNQGLNGKTLTKKKLDAIRKKFATILAEISSPKCMEHADMLMSFRIEFTMALNDSQKTLQSLRDQLTPLKADILQKLQRYLKSSIIALEDIHMFSQWCLSRYNKICKGTSNTPFDDQGLAKHLVLSLWHGVGYHQFRFTQRQHKDYFVDLDMTGYDTDVDDDDEPVTKHTRQKVDWSREGETAIETIIQALQYINIVNVEQGSRLRYSYRRVCDFPKDNAPCPWCYTEKARQKIADNPEQDSCRRKSNYACKSKDFDTSIELAEDVYERLKHHHKGQGSNGIIDLMKSMFLPARETTKEQNKVVKDMADFLKKNCPEISQELLKKLDTSNEGNQDASLSKGGNHREPINWSVLGKEQIDNIVKALQYMNPFIPKRHAKNGAQLLSQPDPLQYMYKRKCNIQPGIKACSWCYSDAACKELQKSTINRLQCQVGHCTFFCPCLEEEHSQFQKRNVACKSNTFQSEQDLIDDVCGRLQHHHNDFNSDDWDQSLKELLFPIQDKNKSVQERVLNAMEQILQKNQAEPYVDQDYGQTIDNGCDGEAEYCDICIEDYPSQLTELCKELNQDSSYIQLNSFIYNSRPFAKGNAECHHGWCFERNTLLCVKVIPKKNDDTELIMLQKLTAHINGEWLKHNLVQFFDHEDKETKRFLKFELVHPTDCFKTTLASFNPEQVTAYMRQLLRALTYLHKNCSIIHRDIKPDNFVHHFVTGKFRLLDFGSAEYYDRNATSFKTGGGTRGFRAPEKLRRGKTKDTPAVDVWSAGMILLSLLTGKTNILSRQDNIPGQVCDENHLREIGFIVGNTEMRRLNDEREYGEGCHFEGQTGWAALALQNINSERKWKPENPALDLLSKMLQVKPSLRITSEAALDHPYLKENNVAKSKSATADELQQSVFAAVEKDAVISSQAKNGEDTNQGLGNLEGKLPMEANVVTLSNRTENSATVSNEIGKPTETCTIQKNDVHHSASENSATVSKEIGKPTETCTIQKNDVHHSGSITVGHNILAREDQNLEWEMAILTGCRGQNYEVHFVEKQEVQCVTAQNIKPIDWPYWKQVIQSWNFADFNKALVEWETPTNWIIKGLEASEDCQIGTVVAHHSGYKGNGNLNLAKSNSTDDFNCEIICVRNQDTTSTDQIGGKKTKGTKKGVRIEKVSAFLVTTKHVLSGQKLTWYEASDLIPVNCNVLVQLEEGGNWTPAIVRHHGETLYDVYSFSVAKIQSIPRRNIKIMDWNYWKHQMKSWTYANFKDALVEWNTQVGAKNYPDMGRGLEALEDCQMGTVVAEYSGFIAYKDTGILYLGGFYPAMDVCMQQHNSVRIMQEKEWEDRKEHCVTLRRGLGSDFCIDGYSTTCSTLDNLHDHGGVGWGALLNSAKYSKCNCRLVWVSRPDICRVDAFEHLEPQYCTAAFLVTNKNVTKGDQLTWYYKGDWFHYD